MVLSLSSELGETEYQVGCSSWLDASLLAEGSFYPDPKMTADERLRWYARFFDCVEVNATYYALPSSHNSELWAARTPPGVEFAVKAYSLMTGHHPKAQALPKDLKAMLPQPLPVNARGEINRKHFPKEALDLCFQWFRSFQRPRRLGHPRLHEPLQRYALGKDPGLRQRNPALGLQGRRFLCGDWVIPRRQGAVHDLELDDGTDGLIPSVRLGPPPLGPAASQELFGRLPVFLPCFVEGLDQIVLGVTRRLQNQRTKLSVRLEMPAESSFSPRAIHSRKTLGLIPA